MIHDMTLSILYNLRAKIIHRSLIKSTNRRESESIFIWHTFLFKLFEHFWQVSCALIIRCRLGRWLLDEIWLLLSLGLIDNCTIRALSSSSSLINKIKVNYIRECCFSLYAYLAISFQFELSAYSTNRRNV